MVDELGFSMSDQSTMVPPFPSQIALAFNVAFGASAILVAAFSNFRSDEKELLISNPPCQEPPIRISPPDPKPLVIIFALSLI